MQKASYDIVIFLIVVSGLILFLIAFIISMLYLYKKKQQTFVQSMETLKADHEKAILNTQLEIQEQTFQHISREIHDNISLSLTLAKLHLNTFDWDNKDNALAKVNDSVKLLSQSISDLSDISKSLNADTIAQHGLTKAIEDELDRVRRVNLFNVHYYCTGNPVFLEPQKEIIIFRIIQEAFNNIIKHAHAKKVELHIHYNEKKLSVTIEDNGKGFNTQLALNKGEAGLKNIQLRAAMLDGTVQINSKAGDGTSIYFTIPFTTHG